MTDALKPVDIERLANDPGLRHLEVQLTELAVIDESDALQILADSDAQADAVLSDQDAARFVRAAAADWLPEAAAPPRGAAGHTAFLRGSGGRFSGRDSRGPALANPALWLGAAALLLGGFLLRGDKGAQAEAPGLAGPHEPIYLDNARRERSEPVLVPMPETVDFSDHVAGPAPFKLRVLNLMRDPRHDEARTLFSDVLYTTRWSYDPTRHPELPEVFRLEVSLPGDVVGTSPRWVATYLRP